MTPDVVLDGLILGESPRRHKGKLWVADWAAPELLTLDAGGSCEVVERPSSIPSCIDWLPDGRLLLVSGDRLLRREPGGTLVTHAEPGSLDAHPWNYWPAIPRRSRLTAVGLCGGAKGGTRCGIPPEDPAATPNIQDVEGEDLQHHRPGAAPRFRPPRPSHATTA